jgi:hypothetical protein
MKKAGEKLKKSMDQIQIKTAKKMWDSLKTVHRG